MQSMAGNKGIFITFFIIVCTFYFKTYSMQDAQIVLLAGKAIFSPSGKLLLVFEENKGVALHETKNGKKLGDLENIVSEKDINPSSFIFSPKETYIGFKNRIWTATDQKEHFLKFFLESETVEAWNTQETIFLTKTQNINPSRWYVNDATTANRIDQISGPAEPSDFSISDNGNLFSFTYPIQVPLFTDATEPRSTTVIRNIKNHAGPLEIQGGLQTFFFSDNVHALVTCARDSVYLVNAQSGYLMREYVCGNNSMGKIPCNVSIDGMQSMITHPSAGDFYSTINYYDGAKYFSFKKHESPPIDPKLISNTKQFRIKRVEKAAQLYLYHRTDVHYRPQLLLDSVNAQEEDAFFCGNHDEHILVLSKSKILYILRMFYPHYLRRIEYKAISISPDRYSFVFTDPEGKHIFCILPHASDILAKEQTSYFSLLPEDIRKELRDFKP